MLLDPEMLDEIGVGMIVRDLDGVVRLGNGAAVSLVPDARPGSVVDGWPADVVTSHRTIASDEGAVVISLVAPIPEATVRPDAGAARAGTDEDALPDENALPEEDALPDDDAVHAVAPDGDVRAAADAGALVPPPASRPASGPPPDEAGLLLDAVGLRQALRRHVEGARLHGHPLTVVSLGVDGAADVAELWGAEALDGVRAGVAQVLSAAMRATDSAAAVDTDRLLVVLPGTRPGDAVALVARLQEVCRRWVTTPDGEAVAFSAGVAAHAPDDGPDDVVGRAEAALDRAKAAGRDRIEVA